MYFWRALPGIEELTVQALGCFAISGVGFFCRRKAAESFSFSVGANFCAKFLGVGSEPDSFESRGVVTSPKLIFLILMVLCRPHIFPSITCSITVSVVYLFSWINTTNYGPNDPMQSPCGTGNFYCGISGAVFIPSLFSSTWMNFTVHRKGGITVSGDTTILVVNQKIAQVRYIRQLLRSHFVSPFQRSMVRGADLFAQAASRSLIAPLREGNNAI